MIIICDKRPPSNLPLISDKLNELFNEIYYWNDNNITSDIKHKTMGLLIFGHPIINDEILDEYPNLKCISNFGVGYNHIDVYAARRRGIVVGYTPNVLNETVADLGFGLLINLARRINEAVNYCMTVQPNVYNDYQFLGYDIHHKVLGIVGLGRIGMEVAKRAFGFDMKILYHNRKRLDEEPYHIQFTTLNNLLKLSDFVMLIVPVSKETTNLIGYKELKLMKKSAILINIARGKVLNHNDLVKILEEEAIAGAALDVTEPEPLPKNHPLYKFQKKNVIISPHIGSCTSTTRLRMGTLAINNLYHGVHEQALTTPVLYKNDNSNDDEKVDNIGKYWDKIAKEYSKQIVNNEKDKHKSEIRNKSLYQPLLYYIKGIISHHSDIDQLNILDYGCGNGQFVHLLSQINVLSTYNIIGTDISNTFLSLANEKYGSHNIKFQSITSVISSNIKFNIITCILVVHITDQFKNILKIFRSLLEKNGNIYIVIMNPRHWKLEELNKYNQLNPLKKKNIHFPVKVSGVVEVEYYYRSELNYEKTFQNMGFYIRQKIELDILNNPPKFLLYQLTLQ